MRDVLVPGPDRAGRGTAQAAARGSAAAVGRAANLHRDRPAPRPEPAARLLPRQKAGRRRRGRAGVRTEDPRRPRGDLPGDCADVLAVPGVVGRIGGPEGAGPDEPDPSPRPDGAGAGRRRGARNRRHPSCRRSACPARSAYDRRTARSSSTPASRAAGPRSPASAAPTAIHSSSPSPATPTRRTVTEPMTMRARVRVPVKVVHHALTDPNQLRVWLTEHVEVELPHRYAFWGRLRPGR